MISTDHPSLIPVRTPPTRGRDKRPEPQCTGCGEKRSICRTGGTRTSHRVVASQACGIRHRSRVVIWGAEHAATVVGFLRAQQGRSAPPGSTVPGCQTVRVFIVQLLVHQDSHLVSTPVFWAKVSLRCQDSSFPSQTRGIVFAEHFRRRAAGERGPRPHVVYEFRVLWKLST